MKDLIFNLCSTSGVSGDENKLSQLVARLFSEYCTVTTDKFNNVLAVIKKNTHAKTILFDSHMDQIGFVVTEINKNGFVKVEKCGGIDFRTIQDCGLIIHGKTDIFGIVCCLPPHLSDGREDKAINNDRVYVDTGLPYDTLVRNISLGDSVSFHEEPVELLNGKIASPSLDNRAGVASLLQCAKILSNKDFDVNVTFLLSSGEETYAFGAKTGTFAHFPDEAIVVDVSFASQAGISGQYSKINLSDGPMICYSSTLDKDITNTLISLCMKKQIKYQTEVCSMATGTNADSIAVTKNGVKTGLVSIPQKNMHTQAEIVSIDDVENTALLLSEYVLIGGAPSEH